MQIISKFQSGQIIITDTNIRSLGEINGKIFNGKLVSWGNDHKGNFDCRDNPNLINFSGSPEKIDGDFNGYLNKSVSRLKGMPKEVTENVSIWGCNITSLEGITNKIGTPNNPGTGFLNIYKNPIDSFEGIHKHFKGGFVSEIKIPKDLKSNILGLLLINQLNKIIIDNQDIQDVKISNLREVVDIINRHLKADKDVLECQEELIENGFKEYARL